MKSLIKVTSCPGEVFLDHIYKEIPDTNKIYNTVENMPQFKKGDSALIKFFSEHLIYPEIAKENGVQGTVYLRFEVKKTGDIGKIELQRGVDLILDQEAIKVIKLLPNFKPGEQNGKKVNVWYSIAVPFKLN